jgi:glycosyltransferase involved in cell wall biosynthesis
VGRILRSSEIGVLSSYSEGLPVSLLEYGATGIAAVATNVGQCREVLADGDAGIVVPAGSPGELAKGLLRLLRHEDERQRLAQALADRVRERHNPASTMAWVGGLYDRILAA